MQARIAAIILCSFAGAASAQVGTSMGLLDANSATEAELRAANVDAAVVTKITASRPFASASALDELLAPTLSEQQRDELYGRVFVTINLNTASRAEILLIPGLNERMAHEFEEYRPYTSLEQFRREIGKYVPANEVARLEQYVFVPMSLNKATGEAFMTIPRMTQRMVHEFEEYRPYTSFDQFRREIGKYVDQKEVARYERYLTIE
ncbi:MAG TPA: helix-hairpin-helix domain-containing protein [Gammaproteobacteria bacterium]|nr:helix-hairpin-helix domain-containing protein [Gammaproteobacteria bacterium]